jgi:leader peptidase (prepilin peptidase) / N-methyltransferase
VALLAVGKIAHKDIPISFGPFLAAAGLLAMILGPEGFHDFLPFAFPFEHY